MSVKKPHCTRREANYRMATDSIIRERNRRLSAETLDIRRKVLEKTAEISDQIFEDVRMKLDEFMKTSSYDDLLYTQIINAKDFAKDDSITVYINPTDAEKKALLEEKTGVSLTVSDRDFVGGIRAVIPSHSILIDHSFLTKLEEEKSNFTL